MEWIILPLFGAPFMTALTYAAWYSIATLVGGPVVDPDKLGAIICGWAVLITVGFWAVVLYEDIRSDFS